MFLIDMYEIISGAGSILLALVLIFLIFKVTKGIIKTIFSILVLVLITLAILFFVGVI